MTDPVRPTALSAVQVGKTYGRGESAFTALSDVSLDVAQGESVAIIGKSGSGKSTLMHVLALLDEPDHGHVQVGGLDARTLSRGQVNTLRNKTFGFVFQQFFLTASQSVFDNVALPLTIASVSRAERKRRTMAALEQLGLADKANNRATDLSGGQKQRVVIARALVNDPSVIFADEPTGNLDSATGAEVENALFDLQRNHGITLVIVTHDDELAARCDRSIRMSDGRIVPNLAVTTGALA